jgi:serine/threonine-protein kinase HipA
MKKNIQVNIHNSEVGNLFYEKDKNRYGFNYLNNLAPISLIMPYKKSTYIWNRNLHPIFDMNMPEGYLLELFKKHLNKEHSYIDDFLIFSYLCSNIESRLTYKSWFGNKTYNSINIQEVIENDNIDTFTRLVKMFMQKNAISGIQPKTIALLKDKESITTKEYIIKTWGKEYQFLAENEYFCLKAVQKTGVKIPHIQLSINNKFLIIERFNYDKNNNQYLGFEEILVLQGKNKDQKYSGSYEQVVKTIYEVTTDKLNAMNDIYKTIIMNYLLKNGDAHLKNFGILYDKEFKNISLAPAYDIVNTTAYFFKDRPALTMFGKKVWYSKKMLLKFGREYCYLSSVDAISLYEQCESALEIAIAELEDYLKDNIKFINIGKRMLDSWNLSLENKTFKEIPFEVTQNWSRN